MKKTIALICLGCIALVSCEKPQIITPTFVGINKISQSDSIKVSNNDVVIPPDLPTGTGRPK